MTKSTTSNLLLVLACLCRVLSYGQANPPVRTADQSNFNSFSQRTAGNQEAWKKFNKPGEYAHPEFGLLPPEAPCKECVELLDRRKADERVFRSSKDPSEILIQKSMGDLHYLKKGQWISIEDKLKQTGPGQYQSDYYVEPVGIDAQSRKSYILTPKGKVFFNQWSLYAKTATGEQLLARADWSNYTAGDDGMYIKNIFKGIDAELRVYRGAVKTSFIMKRNDYGVFEQLIFRDEYGTNAATRLVFADDAALQTGTGKLLVYSGNDEVLQVNEAVIYPKGAAKNNILTAAYTITDKHMDILVPYTWIKDNIGQHELVIDPTVTGSATLGSAAITGSKYNASCSFDSACTYNLSVNIPPATTVSSVQYSFTYMATAPCFGSDGGVKFSSGSCATQIYTNQSQTPGPTIMTLVPITGDVQACIPAPSCTAQTMPFSMHFYRACKGATGCNNNCIGAAAPWIVTIRGKTVEFNDMQDPISYTTNDICVGDSIYVSTWANYGVPPYNYNWSFNPTGIPSLGAGASTSITFPNIVNNTIYAIITDACNNTAIDSLPINVNFAAVVATPSSDTLCSGETTNISLTSPVPGTLYSWTVNQNNVVGASGGFGNTITQTLTTTGGTQGTVTYTITPQNGGCTGAPITVVVTVNPPILVMIDSTICTNQIPITWNNQVIFGGGAYIATHTMPSLVTGCDSTTVLNLTVNPDITHTVNETICANQLPYVWNGITVTAGGTGVASISSTALSNNCDSTTTLNLAVVNILTATVSATICADQLPYLWNGISVTTGGPNAATDTSTSVVSGCDSVTTLNLTVNPLPAVTMNVVLCANQMPYTWNGQTITSGGTGIATYTVPSLATGCDSTTTLNLTVHPVINNSQSVTICASQLPYSWNGHSVTAGGTLASTYTTPSLVTGCDSTTTLNLTVNPLFSETRNVTICSSQLPYTWNGITLTAGGNAAAVFTTPSLVTGCDSTTTLNLTVNPVLTATVNTTICTSQLPYTWNGINVTTGGTAIATFTTTSLVTNCDSTTTLNLTVNPVLTATVNATICASQLPYTWNGITVTAGGSAAAVYTTTTAGSGCDSIVTLNLTVNPLPVAIDNVVLCANQMPYTWNGQTITSGGTAVATAITSSLVTGCDSTTTLNLTVNPVITNSQNLTICANQLPYNWNGQSITAGGSAVATYTTASLVTGCDSTTTLNLMVNPLLSETRNMTICSNQLPYSWNGIAVTAGGTAAAVFTTASLVTGCDSTTTLNLTVNPVLTAIANATICASQLPYSWNGINVTAGGVAAASFTTPSLVTNCDSTTTLNLTVNPVLTTTVNNTICANQLPYTWNGIAVTAGGTAAATYATTAASGCDSITTLNLTVNPLPAAIANVVLCANQMPYTWNGQTITTSGAAVSTYVTPSSVTGCDSTTTLNLTVNPVVTHIQSLTICANQLPYSWNGQSVTAGGAAAATYTTASLVTGCDSTVTLNLTVNPLLTATKQTAICANQLPYLWNGISVTAGGAAAAVFTTPSLVTGCDSTTTLNLTINPVLAATVNMTICANQLPYTWNGINVTTGGASAATFTTTASVTNCDSTTTLNLTINPVLTATVNNTICAGQLPYTWNGINVTAGGVAAATYTTTSPATGCDSTTTLNLTVNPVLTAIKNQTICAGQLPYTWNGITVTAGGASAAVFTTPSLVTGCDSTTTLNLTVNPLITAVKTISICNSQLPYTWNGQTITAGGTAVATFTTPSLLTGCDSTITLNLSVNPVILATKNMTICANQLPYTWNGINVTAGGMAAATFTTPSLVTNCDSTTTLNLTVNPVLTATKNQTICSGLLPYTWNGIMVAAGGTAVATFTTPSLITNCDSITTLNLTVVPALTDTQQVSICANQLPYTWNGITVTAGGPAAAVFNSTASNNCDSITTLHLTVKPVYAATIDTNICFQQTPFTWNGQSYNSSGSYIHTFSSALGCDSVVTLALHVSAQPQTLLPKDSAGCGQVHFKGNTYTVNTIVQDTLFNNLGCDSAYRTTNIKVLYAYADTARAEICAYESYTWEGTAYNQSGVYSHKYVTPLGCDSVLNLDLKVWPLSQVSISHNLDDVPCEDDTVTVTGSGAASYLWKINDLTAGNEQQGSMVLSFRTNIIKVYAKDMHGCESEASVTIETKACCQMMIPNAFSPNGDGKNDKFGPETLGNPKEFKMMIFNRYGQLLFTSTNIADRWDGTFQGKPVDLGTYFFRIFNKCTTDTEETKKGDITLIR